MGNYDVIIIGAGVIGASVARYLSRFNAKVLVLEKHNDVGEETTNANSAIVHSGYDPLPNTVKAKFNVDGNKMMPELCKELDVHFKKIGSLTVAFSKEEDEVLNNLLERAKANKVTARIVNHQELVKMEPNISNEATSALYCEDAGIVSPFNLCVNLIENAMDNGVTLKLNSEVTKIEKIGEIYNVFTQNNEFFESKIVINCAGLYSDKITSLLEKPRFEIIPRKGEYILLDHFDDSWVKHTLFMCPTKVGKGVLISPTTSNNYIIGPSNTDSSIDDTSTDTMTFNYLKDTAKKLIPNIPYIYTIREFAGVRANNNLDDFIIEESKENKGFIIVGGIMSPGLASSPAIGKYVSELVAKDLNLTLNKDFNPTIRKHFRINDIEKSNEFIKEHPQYGHMICRCEKVSEGEIVDVINRNCGAKTIKGVKKRVRAGFGKCQGTFCQCEVLNILSRELHIDKNEILYNEFGTNVLKFPSKGEK